MNLLQLNPQVDRSLGLISAQADHVLLSLSIWNFRRLFTGARPPDAARQFVEIQQLITEKISEHFADEENHVFPLLLANNPGLREFQVIADLYQAHATLLAQAQRLNTLLPRINLAKCKGEHWSAIRIFLTDLEKHAATEDRLFESAWKTIGSADRPPDCHRTFSVTSRFESARQ